MSTGWQTLLLRCKYEPRIIAYILALLRIAICFWPQTGYIHPDEFFQSPDVSAGKYFDSKVQNVWEFTTNKPIRCMLVPTVLNQVAFKLATIIQKDPSAYLLLVTPRLIYTLLSFTVDVCLYKLCQYYSSRGLWYLPVSIIFQTSFVCLSCMTRTFNNVIEVILFALLLVVVCRSIRPRFRILFVTPTRSTPAHETIRKSTQLSSSILIGTIVTFGSFNRPTYPCFALVPLIYWLSESLKRNSYNLRLSIQRVLFPVATSALLTATIISGYDTYYYKGGAVIFEMIGLLIDFKFTEFRRLIYNNWIVTPYNFILFNTNVENLTSFTLHPPYTHMLVNIPLAFNVLGIMFYKKLIHLMTESGGYRLIFSSHRVYALMLLSTLTSTILLSFIPHQEFRFLLPLIVPLTYVFSFNIYASNRWLTSWLLINFILIGFYGSIHQSGVTRASLALDPLIKSYFRQPMDKNETLVDVVAFRCYIVPSYQWNIPRDDRRFHLNLQNTFDEFEESVESKLDHVLSRRIDYPDWEHKLFIMLPHLYVKSLRNCIEANYRDKITDLNIIQQFPLNFNSEDLKNSVEHIQKVGLRAWREAFGFTLMEASIITSDN